MKFPVKYKANFILLFKIKYVSFLSDYQIHTDYKKENRSNKSNLSNQPTQLGSLQLQNFLGRLRQQDQECRLASANW